MRETERGRLHPTTLRSSGNYGSYRAAWRLTVGFALLLAVASAYSADLADFLILDNPQVLSILNKYEQPLSSNERRLLAPRTPLRILSENQLLGDQLSSAMRVDLDGQTLYLQLDDQGKLVNEGAAGVKRILRRCEVLGDTVTVTRNGGVSLSRDPGLGGSSTPVVKGAQLEVVLKTGATYCVKLLGIRPVYGWCPVSSRDAWRASGSSVAAIADTVLSPAIKERIVSRMESANRSYTTLFGHYNKETGQGKTSPQWNLQTVRGALVCTLKGPHNAAAMLESSTRVLVEDVRRLLIGKPFSVTYANGVLRVEPGEQVTMRARALEHLLSIVLVTATLVVALVFVQGRGGGVSKAGALPSEVAGLAGLNLDNAFDRAALADVLDIFYPGQAEKNAAAVVALERHRQSSLVRNLSQSNVKEQLTWRKSGQIAAMFAKFLLVYVLVMVVTYYGVETIGVWRFVLRRRRVMSSPEKLRTIPQRARRLVFSVVSFVASFVLFCPAYVLAYTMRTEFGTDSVVFMVLLGVISNGLLMMYSNKFYTFLITESRKGYVETALAKNLNASYERGTGGISRSAMLRPFKRFDGHVFGHIFTNAQLQYISSIKEQATFLITGLIIVEMALNIHGHLNYEMLRQILYRNYDIVIAIILCIFYTVKGTEIAVDALMHRAAMRYENR